MGMVVRSNLMAMNANRQLGMNSGNVSKSLEKLSSGFKINRAGDDASGLAISEKMKAQIKGLEQASANSQDGISLVQTAEGALTEVHDMLNRMVELATKSANGTIQDDVDRDAIQAEVDALNEEINRISDSTNFNGIKLLDGSLSNGGAGSSSAMVSGKLTNYSYSTLSGAGTKIDQTVVDAAVNEKMTIDGVTMDINWEDMTSEQITAIKQDWTANTDVNVAKKAAATMQDFLNAAIDKHNAANGTDVQHVKFEATDANNFKLSGGTKNKDSLIIFHKDNDTKDTPTTTGLAAQMLGGTAGKTEATTATAAMTEVAANEKMYMNIGGNSVAVNITKKLDGKDGDTDAANLQADIQNALTNYLKSAYGDETKGPFQATDVTVRATNDGRLEIVNKTGESISFAEFEGGETASKLGLGGSTGATGGGLVLQVGDTSDDYQKVSVSVEDMSAGGLGVEGLNVNNQTSAGNAIDRIKAAINKVSTNRANMGALQNRLEHTINNLDVAAENMTAANSRIRDTDMAKQMMDYTKMNVLTQSAQAMLAQANQQPQSVLQLLQ